MAVLSRSNWRCADCGGQQKLELHHRHYETVGNESPGDLVALCRDCHEARHRDITGDFWSDPIEKQSYWDSFVEASTKDD